MLKKLFIFVSITCIIMVAALLGKVYWLVVVRTG